MLNFPSPHVHLQSLDTASTPEAFVRRELELGTGTLTCTDHGTLAVVRKAYDLAKADKLTFVPGLEAYFRDDNDPILDDAGVAKSYRYRTQDGSYVTPEKYAGLSVEKRALLTPEDGYWDHWKYAHLTMHFMDHEAYIAGVKILSAADSRAERHGSERKPLFAWKELEELGSKNVTFGSGCLIGVVARNLMAYGRPDLAMKYYERLRSTVKPGNFFVEVFPHVCDRNWSSGVLVTFEDDTTEEFPTWKTLKTNVGKVRAEDLANEFSHKNNAHATLNEVMVNRKWVEREPRKLKSVVLHEGFIVNECSPWSPNGDLQETCNRFLLYAAKKYGDPVIISDDSHYATPEDKIVQDVRLGQTGNWKFHGLYHRQTSDEAFEHFQKTLGTSQKEFEGWVANNRAWAEKFKSFEFKDEISLPTKFYPEDTLKHCKKLIDMHGRMRWDNPVWMARLQKEIQLLHFNGKMDWLPYFFVIEEALRFYEDDLEELTGPGRGSAAGLLLAYVLSITHADPIEFGLSEDRFMTMDRIQTGKNPDIDVDFGNREPLINPETGWLKKRFGDHFMQISTDTTMKVRSSVKDVARVLHGGKIPQDIEELTKKFLTPPQGIEDRDFVFGYENEDGEWVNGVIDFADPKNSGDKALQTYITRYPGEWEVVNKCLGLARNKGRHPCAHVIANKPIADFIPTTSVSGITVTQYTAGSVEAVGGQKIDLLGVNSLCDVGDCIKIIQEGFPKIETKSIQLNGERVPRSRLVHFKGQLYDIWKLPEDQAVYHDICQGKTETVFQFNTPGAIGWLSKFNFVKSRSATETKLGLSCAEDLAAFTALDRPGPLDYYLPAPPGWKNKDHGPNMLEEFARRAAGLPKIGSVPILDQLLPETYGIIVYQEQLMKVFEKVGKTTAIQAANFREHISKKKVLQVDKDKIIFMNGAIETLGQEGADNMWEMLKTFGNYGFNKSHAVCYASKLSYACAFLKHHYPLQWWTSVLRNAEKGEVSSAFWRYCGHLIDMPDANLSGPLFEIQNGRIRAPTKLLKGIGEKAHEELLAGAPYKDINDLCKRIQDRKIATGEWVDAFKDKKVPETDPDILKENKKAKMTIQVPYRKFKMGRSALHTGIISTLIISGAMDSLFKPDMMAIDMLQAYEAAMAEVQGKKNPEQIGKKYGDLNQFARYQMRKTVLPAFSADLLELVLPMAERFKICQTTLKPSLTLPARWPARIDKSVPFLSGHEIVDTDLMYQHNMPLEGNLDVAAVAYVKAERKFSYGGAARKEAIQFTLDINGTDIDVVKWSGKEGKLDHTWDRKWVGAIVIVQLVKFAPDRFFSMNEIKLVQDVLDLTPEESPA